MNANQRSQLIDALLDGNISDADFLRLEAEFSLDAAARQEYYQRLKLTTLLELEATSERSRLEPSLSKKSTDVGSSLAQPSTSVVTWRRAFIMMATAALVLLVAMGGLLSSTLFRDNANRNNLVNRGRLIATESPSEQQAVGFAVLTGQVDSVWPAEAQLADGSLVPQGKLHLQSGVAQFELFSGVSVVVEGEAEFEILSAMEMRVDKGKVSAHVPEPAHGFRILTSEGEVVDLGTDFALNVGAGKSEVHVLEGEVEWHPLSQAMRRLEKGNALRWTADGQGEEIQAHPELFVGATQLLDQMTSARTIRYAAWQNHCESLQQDDRLVALYHMGGTERWSRRLPNLSVAGAEQVREGAIVAATRATDRWGNPDGGLDFSPTGSRVRLSLPGEYRSLTLNCWVKINSLDRWYNSLFLTDGHDLHEPHWQIMDDGRLFFSVKKRDQWNPNKGEKDKHIFYSPPFWNSSLSGQWLMITTVYDVDAQQVTHYLNGEQLSQEAIPSEYLVEQVSIGNASLGNWGSPERDEPRFAVRNLNGSMDEFAIYSAALSAAEVQDLYANGKP
jgi:anti-sigma factor RsiW